MSRSLSESRPPAPGPGRHRHLEDGLGGAELGGADERAAGVVGGEDGRPEVDEPDLPGGMARSWPKVAAALPWVYRRRGR